MRRPYPTPNPPCATCTPTGVQSSGAVGAPGCATNTGGARRAIHSKRAYLYFDGVVRHRATSVPARPEWRARRRTRQTGIPPFISWYVYCLYVKFNNCRLLPERAVRRTPSARACDAHQGPANAPHVCFTDRDQPTSQFRKGNSTTMTTTPRTTTDPSFRRTSGTSTSRYFVPCRSSSRLPLSACNTSANTDAVLWTANTWRDPAITLKELRAIKRRIGFGGPFCGCGVCRLPRWERDYAA